MKNFILELKDMCSSSNTSSRGFYIMVTACLVLLPVAVLSGIVSAVIYTLAGNFQLLPVIIAVVCLAIFIGLIVWLKRS